MIGGIGAPAAAPARRYNAPAMGKRQPENRWLVEVQPRDGFRDCDGASVLQAIREFGIASIEAVHASRLYELAGPLSRWAR